MSADYTRTRISRIQCSGYRSLYELDLQEIPDLVVLHGPNGSGKSNILRIPWLLMRWAARRGDLPMDRKSAWALRYQEASTDLCIRPADFAKLGTMPEMRLSVDLELGTRAKEAVGGSWVQGKLHLRAVAQDTGDGFLRVWFERADVGDQLRLGDVSPNSKKIREQIEMHRNQIEQLEAQIQTHDSNIRQYENNPATAGAAASVRQQRKQTLQAKKANEQELKRLESLLSQEDLAADRLRYAFLANHVLHRSSAYRRVLRETTSTPGMIADDRSQDAFGIQQALFRAATSEDEGRRKSFREFERRLGKTGMFPGSAVSLTPIISNAFDEYQLLISVPGTGELPLDNLGTGQQQLIILLAESHVADCPILQIEEPEAHLHTTLMDKLTSYLSSGIREVDEQTQRPAFDQIWLATHNHQFALAPTYLDVSLGSQGTEVRCLPRSAAANHFYEPGPLWDVLRDLVDKGIPDDSIILYDAEGNPVHARQILESIKGDHRLAKEYAKAASAAIVMALQKSTDPNP